MEWDYKDLQQEGGRKPAKEQETMYNKRGNGEDCGATPLQNLE